MADQIFAVNCGFFDAVNSDRTYSADDMNKPYSRVIANGVFATPSGTPSTDLQVVSAGNGMQITIQSGQGIFGGKWFENQSSILITVPNNTAINPRMDSVIVQVDKRVSGRVGNIVYRTGTPGASAPVPEINTIANVIEYRIANIYVAPSANTINNDAITDLRGSSSCPWVTSLIQQVDTSTLWNQFNAAYQAQYEQYDTDYENYVEEQREAWEQFLNNLTSELTVSTNVVKLKSVYVSQSTVTTVPINIPSFNSNTDILLVFINGLEAAEDVKYTLNSNGTSINLKASITAGQTVTFIVFKSVISANLESTISLIQNLNSQLAKVTNDSGWINFTLESGATAYNSSYKPAVRCIGDRVYLRGAFKGVTSLGSTICTLPVAYRPAMDHVFTTVALSGTTIQDTVVINVLSTGQIKLAASSGALSSSAMIPMNTNFALENLATAEASEAALVVTDDGNGNVILSHS